jgi:capsid protein
VWDFFASLPNRLTGYLGSTPRGNRKSPPPSTATEDRIATAAERRGLIDNARDLIRNFSPARAMLCKHLNYCTEFTFQSVSADEGWNRELERYVALRSQAERCDVRGVLDLPTFLRTAEAESTGMGDLGVIKLDSGHLMAVESDCIRSPGIEWQPFAGAGTTAVDGQGRQWIHGVRVDRLGRPQEYSVWRRTFGGFEHAADVPAQALHLLAYRDRFDQVRGIGLMASALDMLRDAGENIDAALLKAKLQNAFGVAFYTQNAANILNQQNAEKPTFDLGAQVNVLNLGVGDKVDFLSAAHPAGEFQDFMRVVLLLALQTLEIPYSFIDESFTNYSGARCAWLHYERACQPKRRRLVALLNWIMRFWLEHGIRERELTLPSGMTPETLAYEWIPQGMPWWKPDEEIRGDLAAIAAGLTTFDRVTRARGTGNVRDNIRDNAAVYDYARQLGFPLQLVPTGSPPADAQATARDNAAGRSQADAPTITGAAA